MKKATTTMKKRKSGSKEGKGGDSPSQRIDARIKELRDWRGETGAASLTLALSLALNPLPNLNLPLNLPLGSRFSACRFERKSKRKVGS
jgi:hypothetical protein